MEHNEVQNEVQNEVTENEKPATLLDKVKTYAASFGKPLKVWLLTPCYGSQVYVNYVTSLMHTVELFRLCQIPLIVEFCKNDSLVPRARNNLLAKAMSDPDMTHVIFIDADITWNPSDILRLLLADKEVVGGIYPLKSYQWQRLLKSKDVVDTMMHRHHGSITRSVVSQTEFIRQNLVKYNVNFLSTQLNVVNSIAEVRHIPTGFMMIQRTAIEKMQTWYPETKYLDDVQYLQFTENDNAYALFDCGVKDGHYYSEDWMFCDRWLTKEGHIFADIGIPLMHTGPEDYSGFILSSLA